MVTINDRNRYAFSYTNHDVRDKRFIFKNLNKSVSYNSNFSNTKFENTSLIATKFKFCDFYGAMFNDCLIRGTLFRKCNLESVTFKNSIIAATVFEKIKFKDCSFINCKVVSSGNIDRLIDNVKLVNTQISAQYPEELFFNKTLIEIVETLRENDFIRKSTVLHRKKKKIDTLSLQVLIEQFGEEFLICHLHDAIQLINAPFHTLSYLQNILRNYSDIVTVESPGPVTHGTL